ncbi:MAG: RDD family protein [Bacteroidota bacterium]
MQTATVIRRLKAFVIDYFIILGYIAVLLGVTFALAKIFRLQLQSLNPLTGELIAFFTLTLPVILYFTLSENGKHGGTIGKRKSGLKIVNKNLVGAGFWQLLVRNCIKFLPWELAHFFLFRLFYYLSVNEESPGWVLTGLLGSQALAIGYLFGIVFQKNNVGVYEILSGTRVIQ